MLPFHFVNMWIIIIRILIITLTTITIVTIRIKNQHTSCVHLTILIGMRIMATISLIIELQN